MHQAGLEAWTADRRQDAVGIGPDRAVETLLMGVPQLGILLASVLVGGRRLAAERRSAVRALQGQEAHADRDEGRPHIAGGEEGRGPEEGLIDDDRVGTLVLDQCPQGVELRGNGIEEELAEGIDRALGAGRKGGHIGSELRGAAQIEVRTMPERLEAESCTDHLRFEP